MEDLEMLKKIKRSYEYMCDISENAETVDFDLENKLETIIDYLQDLYNNAYEYIKNKDKRVFKIGCHCKNCGSQVYISDLAQYEFVCLECDENYYLTEDCTVENADKHWWD